MVEGKKDLLESLVKKDKTNNTEETKQDLLKMSEVSIILDTYEDIFSDFDPRPFSQRALSDDFLLEAKKASRERNSGEIEIKFLIPEQKRNIREESLIKKRLHEYFKKHLIQIKDEINSIKKRGYFMVSTRYPKLFKKLGFTEFLKRSDDNSHSSFCYLEYK